MQRFALKQEELRRGPADVVFLGDSIFQNWELHGPPAWREYAAGWELFGVGRKAVNLAFAGDGTPHLLWRIQNWDLSVASPKAAVVLIDVNDLLVAGRPADAVVEGIAAIIDALRPRSPGIRILLLSLLPNRVSHRVTRRTAQVNALLRVRDWGADITLAALDAIFLRDGQIDPAQYVDPLWDPPMPVLLHPAAAAQTRMAQAIQLKLMSLQPNPTPVDE